MKHIIKISLLIMAAMLLSTSTAAALEVESTSSTPSSIFHHVTVFNKQKLGEYEVVSNKIFEDLTITKSSYCSEKGMLYAEDINGVCYKLNLVSETKEVIPSLPESETNTHYLLYNFTDKYEGDPYPIDESRFPNPEDYAITEYGRDYGKSFICNHDGKSLYMFRGKKLSGEYQRSIITNEGDVLYNHPGEYTCDCNYYKSYGKEIIRTEFDILNSAGELLVKDSYADRQSLNQLFNGVFYFNTYDENGNSYFAFCDYDGNLLYKYYESDFFQALIYTIDDIHKENNTYLTDTDSYGLMNDINGQYHIVKFSFKNIVQDKEPSITETPSTISSVPIAKSSIVSEASVQSDVSSTEETSINEQSTLNISSEIEATEAAISTDANKVPGKSKKTILIVISTIIGVLLVGGGAAVYFLKIRKI